MKVLIFVALFAFVAVQLSTSAPTSEDKKKEAPGPGIEAFASPAAIAEVKSADAEPAPSAVPAAPAEEKKAS